MKVFLISAILSAIFFVAYKINGSEKAMGVGCFFAIVAFIAIGFSEVNKTKE